MRVQLRRVFDGGAHDLDRGILADKNLRARAAHRGHGARQLLTNVTSDTHVGGVQSDDLNSEFGD